MAPKVFNKEYLLDWLDELWVLRENLVMDLDWFYKWRLAHLTKKVTRHLIDPHLAEKQRQQYEFFYTTSVQNLQTSQNLEGLRDTVQYLCEQQPIDRPSTHAHYQDLLHNLQLQQAGLHQVQDLFRAGI